MRQGRQGEQRTLRKKAPCHAAAEEAAAQAAAYCLPMDGLPDTGGSSLSGKERGKGRCPGKEKCSDGGHKSGAGCLKPAGGKGNSGPVGVGLEAHPEWEENFLTPNEYSRPGEALEEVKNIFVHYTANPGHQCRSEPQLL